jgi:hypothetical protein
VTLSYIATVPGFLSMVRMSALSEEISSVIKISIVAAFIIAIDGWALDRGNEVSVVIEE